MLENSYQKYLFCLAELSHYNQNISTFMSFIMTSLSLNINAFIFITIISTFPIVYFKLAFGSVIPKKEFAIWVISWYVVTFLAFFTFNFLLFVSISAVFIYLVSKHVDNKLALFCILLFAIPSYQEKISVLFNINLTRELALILLLPLFLQSKKQDFLPKFGKLTIDKFIFCYLVLIFLLQFRGLYIPVKPTTWTEESRWALYFFAEMFLPFYIASRYIKDFKQLKMVILSFLIICGIVGGIGIVESAKSWLLYGNLYDSLGLTSPFGRKDYLNRDGMLRASSTMDHALVLGFVMLVALGLYFFASNFIKSSWLKIAGYVLFIGGLIAPLARGAWVGAAVMIAVYFSLGNKKFRNIAIMTIAGILSLPILTMIPGGQKIINLLPFIGKVESTNIDYRGLLFEKSVLVIKNNPFFGLYDPTKEPEMQDLVQGQGIVDLVNYYLQITLTYGYVGLILFVLILMSCVIPLYKHLGTFKDQKSMEYLCGKSLLALLLGSFITIATLSALSTVTTVLFLLAGLTVSYIRVTKKGASSLDIDHLESVKSNDYPTSRIVKS